MTRVDFYLLKDLDTSAMQRFACVLAAKALGRNQQVHIHTESEAAERAVDALLWEYPDGRFVPHERLAAGASAAAPVTIGHELPEHRDGVLINLSSEIPAFFARFDRIAEIVLDSARETGRDRYKHYRDRGYPLHHHELDDWED